MQVREIKRRARTDQFLDEALEAVNRGAFEKAAKLYMKILEQEPDHVITWLNLGNVYAAVMEHEKAEAMYRRTLQINPHYVFGAYALARLYIQTNRPEAALGVLGQVRELLPADPELRRLTSLARKSSRG